MIVNIDTMPNHGGTYPWIANIRYDTGCTEYQLGYNQERHTVDWSGPNGPIHVCTDFDHAFEELAKELQREQGLTGD